MKTKHLLLIILLTISAWSQVQVKGYYRKDGTYVQPYTRSSPSSGSSSSSASTYTLVDTPSETTIVVVRNPDGKIHRSVAEKHEFMRTHVCPSTNAYTLKCPGYVVDHVVPLACGGADAPSNMQYQTVADGKAKDKWELHLCGK